MILAPIKIWTRGLFDMLIFCEGLALERLNRAKAGKVTPTTSLLFGSMETAAKALRPSPRQCKTASQCQNFGVSGRSTTESRQGLGGKLLSCPVEIGAFPAQRLSAITGPNILFFDIVASVAVGIVVVDIRFNGVPRRFSRHGLPPSNARNARMEANTKLEGVHS